MKEALLYQTPNKTMQMTKQIGLDAGIAYVYPGNLKTHGDMNAKCPKCRMEIAGVGMSEKKMTHNKRRMKWNIKELH